MLVLQRKGAYFCIMLRSCRAEGVKLSKKAGDLDSSQRKLRSLLRDTETERDRLQVRALLMLCVRHLQYLTSKNAYRYMNLSPLNQARLYASILVRTFILSTVILSHPIKTPHPVKTPHNRTHKIHKTQNAAQQNTQHTQITHVTPHNKTHNIHKMLHNRTHNIHKIHM